MAKKKSVSKKTTIKKKATSKADVDLSPVCITKALPVERNEEAARHACDINPMNSPQLEKVAMAFPEYVPTPDHLAVSTSRYWGQGGVDLSVAFLDVFDTGLQRRILSHLNAWDQTANVRFRQTFEPGSAQVRITTGSGGYWSYVGTDIELIPLDQATMNLEGFHRQKSEGEFRRVVRHEAGHTLGFKHEHMRAELVARIDVKKAIKYYQETEGWSEKQTRRQVLTPLEEASLLGTLNPDPYSIMCYHVPGRVTKDGRPIFGGDDIDFEDRQFAAKIYPKPVPVPLAGSDSEIASLLPNPEGAHLASSSLSTYNRFLEVSKLILNTSQQSALGHSPTLLADAMTDNIAAIVASALWEQTQVHPLPDRSISSDLRINTPSKMRALVNKIRERIPSFRLDGAKLSQALGSAPGDTVRKLVQIVRANS